MAAFTQVEALEFMVLFFKRRNIFRNIQVERIREVFGTVVFSRCKFIDQAHFLAVVVVLTSLRSTKALSGRTVNSIEVMIF